jgi:aspartyl-tRNA(Asn)/glutamyl-tRNA(Gln) amidotransferase subunit B
MPFAPTEQWIADVKSRAVELPMARKQRFIKDYGLPASDAEVFKNDVPLGNDFETAIKSIPSKTQGEQRIKLIKLTANLIINNSQLISRKKNQEKPDWEPGGSNLAVKPFPITEMINLAALVQANTINVSIAQQVVLPAMIETGLTPALIVQEKGLAQVSDTGVIEKFCDEAIAANPGPVADFKAGKAAALNFLKGQVMKSSKGKANPALAGEILERKLKA